MAQAVTFKKVIVNHSGSCEGFHYTAGQPVKLSERALQAIGTKNYKEYEQPKEPSKGEEKK